MKVAVIGAGVTGLTMAWLLQRRGLQVTVFEASDHEGGLAATVEHEGFRFDLGPHEFCTENPELVGLLRELCGPDLLERQKVTAQHFMGRFVPYPFGVVDVIRSIPLWLTARAVVEIGWRRLCGLFRRPSAESFASWTIDQFGPTLYRLYFGPYTRKVWGIDPEAIDARTASQRIAVDSIWDLARKVFAHSWFGRDDFAKVHSEFRKGFLYTRGGAGGLQRHLRQGFEAAGGRIEVRARLERVELHGDGSRVAALHFAGGAVRSEFDYVVSTMSLPALVKAVRGAAAAPLLAQNELPFRGMAFVFLNVDKPKVTDNHWIYFPADDVPFQRLTEFSHFGADMCPPGKTGIVLEVACNPGEPLWQRSDRELVELCVTSLQRLGLLAPAEVLASKVLRIPNAYPVQVQGYVERAERLLHELAPIGNLVTIGRQGLFRYCNQNECMEMALAVAPEILGGRSSIRYRGNDSWVGVGIEADR